MLRSSGMASFVVWTLTLFSCSPASDIEAEIKTLLAAPFTATGSDFMTALCGRPTQALLEPTEVEARLEFGSSSSSGRAVVRVAAAGKGDSCAAEIELSYAKTEVGGHGFGGGREMSLRNFSRRTKVEPSVSDPSLKEKIQLNETKQGRLAAIDMRLPDGSPSDAYYIELSMPNPLIRFRLTGEENRFHPKGYLYQDGKLISVISVVWSGTAPYDNVVPLEPGKVVMLITAQGELGAYTITLDEPDDTVRSMLTLPERYKRKAL